MINPHSAFFKWIKVFLWLLVVALCIQCHEIKVQLDKLDIQGHRGCRGLMPENTIPGFKKAIALGVRTLELDVVVLSDSTVMVSHEVYFNHEIATGPDGEEITPENELSHNMYTMTQEEIMSYDVGLKQHPRFPLQKKINAKKTTLTDMVEAIETYTVEQDIASIFYNIEIKRKPNTETIFCPPVNTMVDAVVNTLKKLNIEGRYALQCFDIETLEYLNMHHSNIPIVYLVENTEPFKRNFSKLSFVPDMYSPYFKLITPDLVDYCKNNEIRLITWTVNEPEDIEKTIKLGVDGIISDYPDRAIEIAASLSAPEK